MVSHPHAAAQLPRAGRVWYVTVRQFEIAAIASALGKGVHSSIASIKEDLVTTLRRCPLLPGLLLLFLVSALAQQQSKPAGVLNGNDLKTVVPPGYFYRGQSASVELRNSGGIRTKDGKYILAGLVDTSGYAADVAQKYQGFFITEIKVNIEGSDLPPGQYGFGFTADKFVVSDVGANDVFSVPFKQDANLKHAVPLKIVEEGASYRFYAGKKYVSLQME
jgi:hypothetical protein